MLGSTSRPVSLASIAAAFDRRFWIVAGGATVLSLLVIGIPTAVIPNSAFTRMTPVEPMNVVTLIASAPLMGLIAATHLSRQPGHDPGSPDRGSARATVGSIGSFLAVGCPVCNKVVVAVLGVSGALNVFAPLQLVIALAALGLLAVTAAWRIRDRVTCARCQTR